MTDTILCVSDEEPVAFHPENSRGFSVRLSYRVEDGDEASARDDYGKFLAALENVRFAAYAVTGNTLVRAADPLVLAEDYAAPYRDEFFKWLAARASAHEARQKAKAKAAAFANTTPAAHEAPAPFPARFFVAAAAGTASPVVKSEDTLGAEDIVLAAASWIAPVPQRLHLAFVLRVTDIAPGTAVVFLPYFEEKVPADTYTPIAVPAQGAMLRLSDYASVEGRSCETSVSKPVGTGQPSTTIDYRNGFAQAGAGSEAGYRMLARVEQRAGSLMNGLLGVRELSNSIRWPAGAEDAPADSPGLQALRLLSWSAVHALATSLDTILIALLMPGRGQRDGALLGPFLDLLIEQLTGALGDKVEAVLPERTRRTTVRQCARDAIRAVFAVAPADTDADAPVRATLVQLLESVCRIENTPNPSLAQADTWRDSLLAYYVTPSDENRDRILSALKKMRTNPGKDPAPAPAQLLDQGLALLQDRVSSESGAEATIGRMLALDGVIDAFAAKLAGGDDDIAKRARSAWTDALDAFRQRLAGDMNGAEAARHAVGSLLADLLLLGGAEPGERGTAAQLTQAFDDSLFWHRRLGMRRGDGSPPPDQEHMDSLVAMLPRPVADFAAYIGQPDQLPARVRRLDDVAGLMQHAAKADLFPSDTARFLPDHAPQALPVRLTIDPAADDDDDNVDDFAAAFSGVALTVRRGGAAAAGEAWAYANLAEVEFPTAPGLPTANAGSIQPIPTTVTDSRRTLFVAYDGLPIASSAFDNTLSAPAAATWDKFIATDYPDVHPGYAPVAPLAYGAHYDIAAHAVGRAGTLPLDLQESGGAVPWRPVSAIPPDRIEEGYVTRYPYSRRTALGRTGITPLRGAGESMPDGLKPLAADYPRLGLSSRHGQFLDVYRNNDGSGSIELPQKTGTTTRATLRDLWLWAANGSVVEIGIAWFTAANAGANAIDELVVKASSGRLGDVVAEIKRMDGVAEGDPESYSMRILLDGTKLEEKSFTARAGSAWLRLRVGAIDGKAAMTLADPAADSPGGAAASRPVPDSLVLLGETGSALWKEPFSRPVRAIVQYPRVGYLDFARWVANPVLRKQVFNAMPRADEFLEQLLGAYIARTGDAELARLLERLPDPAVSELRLELVATDALLDEPKNLTGDTALQAAHRTVSLRPLGDLLMTAAYGKWLDGGHIKAMLSWLDQALSLAVQIESRPGRIGLSPGANVVANVPPGVVARFSARPAVRRALFQPDAAGFPSVMDERLLQWAVGFDDTGDHASFNGDSIQIEAMLGALSHEKDEGWRLSRTAWFDKAHAAIVHEPENWARAYRLMAAPPADDWRWRQLGGVDVSTQRWRFSGRPIYTWIKPKRDGKHALAAGGQTSIQLAHDHPQLQEFESEAFYGRAPYDAEVESALLLPLPESTELIDVPWEDASATMFRHRFTLRSRYAAAMRNPRNGSCDAWPAVAAQAQQGWIRIAMLADRSHLILTRPQLRALVPATSSADEGDSANPPLIGLLQERPFCNGGLAARVAAEIRTGIGFELITQTAPLDARKELGPDPRLSYFGMQDDDARTVVLAAEGPIGLTFDADDAAAPAFSSTALLLAPRRLAGGTTDAGPTLASAQLAEHFMSVVLRRYLDHHWLVDEPTALPTTVDQTVWAPFERTWWIEFPACDGSLSVAGKADAFGMATACCVPAKEGGNGPMRVTVDRYAVDGTLATRPAAAIPGRLKLNHDDQPLTLCSIPGLLPHGAAGGSIVFLHTPLDPRRAILSVFFVTGSSVPERSGAGNAPTLLASIEWSVPVTCEAAEIGIHGAGHAVSLINASASSALQWARTNTNFDTVCAVAPGAADAGGPVGISELAVRRSAFDNGWLLRFQRQSIGWWIRANQSTKPFPVHAQRHIALLPSHLRAGIGKPIDVPSPAVMASGRDIRIPGARDVDRVRIIEFETSAVILGYQAPGAMTVPEHYRSGYIDLKATGFDRMAPSSAPAGWQLSIHIRVIGGRQALESLTSFQLALRSEAHGANWVALPFVRTVKPNLLSFAFVGNLPVASNGTATLFSGSCINADGSVEAAEPTQLVEPDDAQVARALQVVHVPGERDPGSQGLELRLSKANFQAGHAADLWLEISLLASVVREGQVTPSFVDGVDFDWFFGGAALRPDDAVTLGELDKMRESQARIISVSQPINVAAAT